MLTLVALAIALLFLESPWNLVLVVTAGVVDAAETALFVWWSRRRRRLMPSSVGTGTIVGRRGVTVGRLAPSGQVRIDGEIWSARTAEPVDPGESVVVTAVDGLILDVRKA